MVNAKVIEKTSRHASWQKAVEPYMAPSNWRSTLQVLNSVVPMLTLYYLMYRSLVLPYWVTLLMAFPTAGFTVRVFIIMHDCGHWAFFKSGRANAWVGTLCGILTNAPYHQWTREHAIHHATSGDLDRRGVGDVSTLTVAEYQALSSYEKLKYRLYRHPLVTMGIGPHFIFLFRSRFVGKYSLAREKRSVYFTNIALFSIWGGAIYAIGLVPFLAVWVPVQLIAGAWGVWLFYVQHQFEDTYWSRHKTWDYQLAALQGSSYYKLPRIVQWFSGNIGFHHIHHLCQKIPNYNLEACHNNNEYFQKAPTLTFWKSLKCARLKLWDEEKGRMVGFNEIEPAASVRG